MAFSHSSRLAGLKDYMSQREIRLSFSSRWASTHEEGQSSRRRTLQSWGRWAGQKIRRGNADVTTVDEVHLFPGWATKRPHTHPEEPESTFDVVFHVSGFATSRRTPELLTRSQRAFLRLARSFASLPKPQPTLDAELQDMPGNLLLPPRPDEISDDYEVENFDAQFRNSGNQNQDMDDVQFTPPLPADTSNGSIPAELARLHANMESRLKLFWASSLPSRRVQLSVFLQSPDPKSNRRSLEFQPLLTREMMTGIDGHFSATFKLDWNDICPHLAGATADRTQLQHELFVEARIINQERAPELHETPMSVIHIPVTHSTLRVISDIDDTVRISRVLDGARAIFNQVFVRDLEDSVIPEMAEWFGTMWRRGVRFHYVSNSPSELLPLINEFICISGLPTGSVRLRSYTGRSLFEGLLSAPAVRKRGNVAEILDQFPDSQFLLVGDSGEQDLELYSSLAAERPNQVAGVFIRNVSTTSLDDPTGFKADFGLTASPGKSRSRGSILFTNSGAPSRIVPKRSASDTEVNPLHPNTIYIPRPVRKGSFALQSYSFEPSPDPRLLSRVSEDSSSSLTSTGSSPSSSARSLRQLRPVSEAEKRRLDLQNRVNKARTSMPPNVALRVFEDPRECVEADQIVQRLLDVT